MARPRKYIHQVSEQLRSEPLFQGSLFQEALSRGLLTRSMLEGQLRQFYALEAAQKHLPHFLMTKNMVTFKLALEAEIGKTK